MCTIVEELLPADPPATSYSYLWRDAQQYVRLRYEAARLCGSVAIPSLARRVCEAQRVVEAVVWGEEGGFVLPLLPPAQRASLRWSRPRRLAS